VSRFGGGVNRGREPEEGDSADMDEEKLYRCFEMLQAVKARIANYSQKQCDNCAARQNLPAREKLLIL
jgi:hypothetical protein